MIEHLHDREKKLEPFGWRGREAEWVALVCLHSGLFTRAQWCHFFNDPYRMGAKRFVRTLVERGMAVEYALPNYRGGARACRISNKEIYRKLGIENVRHRRDADDSVMLRRLLSLDYVLEYPELPWLPTEPEKVSFFELLGIDRKLLPHRVYQGAVGKQTRYFALKLPIAVAAKTATFAYVDPGKDTDTELRSWGAAHEWLWRALRGKGIQVRAVVIGADHTATRRSKAALQSWSKGASEQGVHKAAGPTQDDPPVKAEMQYIENALVKLDTAIVAKYGGVKGISKRLIELKTLPRSKGATGASIDGYETWVSRRLRMPDADLGSAQMESHKSMPKWTFFGVPRARCPCRSRMSHGQRGECDTIRRVGVTSPTPLFRGRSRPIYPCGKAPDTDHKRALTRRRQVPMKWRYPILISAGLCCSVWGFIYRPFPMPGDDPVLDLVLYHTPSFYGWIVRWYYAAPAVALIVGGLFFISVWRVWFETWGSNLTAFKLLPPWPLSPDKDAGPGIVVGEVHHPVKAVEIPNPSWLIIPERGLYTGVAIFGAVGSGKTSACMHPFAQQILSWQAGNPQRRAAGLILEVKGDFCHDIRRILADAGREEDYIELGMEGSFQWNPLSTKWLDSYSLAYTISSLLNQLFGKGKEPFWQQAYTNLVRWIIELYRVFPGQWVTLQQVYHCAIDKELFAAKIKQAEAFVRELQQGTLVISTKDYTSNVLALGDGNWQMNKQDDTFQAYHSPSLESQLKEHQIPYQVQWTESVRSSEIRQRVEAVNRWYQHDWRMIDNKIRSSIVEGISVFLSIFDLPDVARVFCPPPPPEKAEVTSQGDKGVPQGDEQPGLGTRVRQSLPPLDELIESGKVLALNMPAGTNPALARAVGVMLKNAWLQSLLRRPAQMKESPDQYFRPAVFICDEYQALASVGEDDPSGDEKSFALTRQCRCIPIVATQSISSLRSVLGSSEAWRTLLQTLRTRIFLSLSDDASAQIASALCGQVAKIKPSYTITESAKQSEVSMLSAQAGGGQGSVGASKSFREQREAVFQPREFALLSNCQAICLPYDGAQSLSPTRVYLKPHYLPRTLPYWRAKAEGKL